MTTQLEEARRQAELRVEQARREAEKRLTDVRTAVGVLPRKKHVLMLLAAGAAGMALALRRGRRKSRRKLKKY